MWIYFFPHPYCICLYISESVHLPSRVYAAVPFSQTIVVLFGFISWILAEYGLCSLSFPCIIPLDEVLYVYSSEWRAAEQGAIVRAPWCGWILHHRQYGDMGVREQASIRALNNTCLVGRAAGGWMGFSLSNAPCFLISLRGKCCWLVSFSVGLALVVSRAEWEPLCWPVLVVGAKQEQQQALCEPRFEMSRGERYCRGMVGKMREGGKLRGREKKGGREGEN